MNTMPKAEPVDLPAPSAWDTDLVEVYRVGYGKLVRLAYLLTGHNAVAEEVVQDAFVATHRLGGAPRTRIPTCGGRSSTGAARGGAGTRSSGPPPRPPDPAELAADEMWDALATLTDRQRTAIVLRFYEDMPDDRIAEILGCRQSTVRSAIPPGPPVAAPGDRPVSPRPPAAPPRRSPPGDLPMTLLHDHDRADLEDGVRTMLHRLAAGASERPPAWADLVARHEAVVVPLGHHGAMAGARDRRGGRAAVPAWAWPPPPCSCSPPPAPWWSTAPGPRRWTAPPPRRSPPSRRAIRPSTPARRRPCGPPASTSRWRPPGLPRGHGRPWRRSRPARRRAAGHVRLDRRRRLGAPGRTAAPPAPCTCDRRRSRGRPRPGPSSAPRPRTSRSPTCATTRDELSFTVARTAAEAGQVAVGVWVDGQPVSLGGDAVAQAGAGDVSLGEVVDLGTAAAARDTLRLPAGADDIVTLRVVHVVDGMSAR